MPAVRPSLLNVLTALSLALCVAAVALWARSYVVSDRFTRVTVVHDGIPDGEDPMPLGYHLHEVRWYVYPDTGELTVMRYYWADVYRPEPPGWQWKRWRPRHESHPYQIAALRWIGIDISFEGDRDARSNSSQTVVVPLWLVAGSFAALPAARGVAPPPAEAPGGALPRLRLRPPRHAPAVSRVRDCRRGGMI
jgi:hypothetical protein